MPTLAIASVLAFIGIVTTFLALSALGIDEAIAGPVAAAILGGIPYIREELLKREQARKGEPQTSVVSLEAYGIPPLRLLAYAVFLMFAVTQVASAVGIVLATAMGATPQLVNLAGASALLIDVPLLFLIGSWIGRRAAARGFLITLGAVVLMRVAAALLDLVSVDDATSQTLFGEPISAGILAGQAVASGIIFAAVSLIGYWRGRRQRLPAYFAHLISSVSPESREVMVELAFEEARKHGAPSGGVPVGLWVAGGALALLMGLGVAAGLGPPVDSMRGHEVPPSYREFLQEQGFLEPGEEILYFYSAGLFSVEEDGNLLTNRRIVSYAEEGLVGEVALDRISGITVLTDPGILKDGVLEIEAADGTAFRLYVPGEDDDDRAFLADLLALAPL